MARKFIAMLVCAGALAAPAAAGAAVTTRDWDQRAERGEALVRFERGVGASERREVRRDASVALEDMLELRRTQLVTFDGSVGAAVARLEQQPGVAYAQPNYRYHALAAPPNDPHFGHLWGLGSTPGVGVLPAWDRSRGAGQVIAIVDTGVDLTHQDLVGNLWAKPGQPGVHGHDFVDGDTNPDDFNLHGTHVAGTAAAVAGNGAGVAGVAPQAQIMAVRVLDGDGGGSTSTIADGIAFAAAEGAGVINLSLGGPSGGGDQAMSDAIAQAAQSNAVVVAAAGNGGDDGVGDNNDTSPTTPCTLPNANLICVAALTSAGARSGFSNFGPSTVDLGAPGGNGSGDPDADILSAKPSWGAPLFSEDFQTGTDGWAASHASGFDWGLAGTGIGGESATDSPSANYQANTSSMFQKTSAVVLTGQRGCRIDFSLRLAGVAVPDSAGVGVLTGTDGAGQDFSGDTGGFFERVELSISNLDGSSDAKPTFFFDSNSATQGDGAYVDDYNLLCRTQGPYDNSIETDDALSRGSYTAIAGTSMAAPHVAGVTVTGGAVDAVGAMDAALGLANPPPPAPAPPPPPPPPPAAPAKARFGSVSVNNRGVLTMRVFGNPGASGVLTLTANILRPSAARVMRVARKSFRIGSTGRATVKPRLNRAGLRQLRRTRRLRLRARVVLKNAAGSSTATARIRIRLRRR